MGRMSRLPRGSRARTLELVHAATRRPRTSASSPDVTVRTVRGPDAVDVLGEDLDALLRDTHAPTTARRTWLSCWARHHTEFEAVVIAVSRDGVLAAAAPLAIRSGRSGHEVVVLGHGESDYARLPTRTAADADVLAGAVRAFLHDLPGAWSLHLEQLPVDEQALHALRRRLRLAVVEAGDPAPFAPVSQGGPPAVRPNARKAARKGHNRLERDGRHLEVGRHRTAAAVRELLPELAALRAAREAALGRVSLPTAAQRAFWFAVLPELAAESGVEVITLRVDGVLGAYGVAFLDGRAYRIWDARVSPEFPRYELGHLYRDAALQTIVTDSLVELDWMRGAEEYKMATATHLRPTAQLWGSSYRVQTAAPVARAAWRTQRTARPWLARAEGAVRARVETVRRWPAER